MRVLIVGCGYVGLPLGAELVKQGHEVFGLRRTNAAETKLSARGIKPLMADITRRSELQQLPGPFDWVVNTVSSTKGGVEEYRQVYFEGTRNLIERLAPQRPQKFVYTSSTSVYGQTDGSWVDERSATEPASETGQVLVETERLLLTAAQTQDLPAIILRVAGIYGPERGYWFRQYLKGEATIQGRGERILNMVHRDDLVGIIIAALKKAQPGQIYNAVDDEPVAQIDFFRWLSAALGQPMPPFAAHTEDRTGKLEAHLGMSKRGVTNKRISNSKLKRELGYAFKFPTFREGLKAEMERSPNQDCP